MRPGKAILSTAYFPPIQYITKFLIYPKIEIERYENYNKQSYRNRCIIFGANGPLCLSIPVKKDIHPRIPIAQLKLDYEINWQKIHWKAFEAAYKRSPFFQFYTDDFYPYYHKRYEFLLTFNSAILEITLKLIGLENRIVYSDSFRDLQGEFHDFRSIIHPKPSQSEEDPEFTPAAYNQVFLNKFEFVPNLSILDLLFNEGPNSLSVLKESICQIENRQSACPPMAGNLKSCFRTGIQ
jgi:hypothetical protein